MAKTKSTPTTPGNNTLPVRAIDYLDDRWDDAVRLGAVLKCLRAACAMAESDATLLPCIELGISVAFDEAERLADKLDPATARRKIMEDREACDA